MRIVSDRLSVRWYIGYDLHEPVPDHSSLTRIRDRFGLSVFREFFERIVEECVEAGLVWGEELYFDATKVDANASLDSITPRFYVEEHLGELFTEEHLPEAEQEETIRALVDSRDELVPVAEFYELPSAHEEALIAENASKDDWISLFVGVMPGARPLHDPALRCLKWSRLSLSRDLCEQSTPL
jgi:Transposase domain (DUF772)